MPTITDLKIQKNNKTRANLYLDGEFAFGLEMLTVMKLGLKIGKEVSQKQLEEAVLDSEKSVAFERAMDYLSRGMKTAKQVTDYLQKKAYPPQVVIYVVDKLKAYRYVNDELFAKSYVEQNSKSKGSRRLQQELQQKGISRVQAEQASALDRDVSVDNAHALAKKYVKNKPIDVKLLQRLQRYLLSRGYDFDVVNQVVRSYKTTNDEDEYFD